MKASRGVLAKVLKVAVPAVFLATCAISQETAKAAAIPPPCPPCGPGETCKNYPFKPTECWTTKYGPAKADVVDGTTNLLYCKQGAFALCFFSGPPTPTGKSSSNPVLPCELKDGVANCTCQAFTKGPSFVDINGILNLGAYQQTVAACGHDGKKCANLHNCGKDGTKQGCDQYPPAPVCQYVQNQNPNDPAVSLMPKADLISTFSMTAMKPNYQVGKSPLKGNCQGLYAGCMTAPCFFPKGARQPFADGDPIQCECPTYNGTFQVGQFKQQCEIPNSNGKSYVWSAANNVQGSSLE